MAITPFTQPVQQSQFIPGRRRLPTQAIAQATGQYVQRNEAARDMIDEYQQRLSSQIGDNEALAPVMDRYRKKIEDIASNDLYADDAREIQRLAREAEKDIALVKKNRELAQEELEQLQNLENIDQSRKDSLANLLSTTRSIGATEEGRVDPSSIMGVRNIGDEADRFEVAVDAMKGLKEKIVNEGVQARPGLGIYEFFQETEVGEERIKNAIRSAYASNPGIQNWLQNTARLYQQSHPNKTSEEAREYAQRELDIMAERVAKNREYGDRSVSRRSGDFGVGSDKDDGTGDLVRNTGPINIENIPSGTAQRREYDQLSNAIIKNELEKNLTDEEFERYEQIQDEVDQSFLGRASVLGSISKEERLLREAGIYENVTQAREVSEIRTPDLFAPKMISPGEGNERDYQQFTESFQNQVKNQVDSDDIDMVLEDLDASSWFADIDANDTEGREVKKRMIMNAEDVRISSDGQYFEFTVGDMPDKIYGWDTANIEGENIKINTNNFTESQMHSFTQNLSDSNAESVMANWRYRNISVTTEGTTAPQNENARVRRTLKNRFIVEREQGGEYQPLKTNEAVGGLNEQQKVSALFQQARELELDELSTLNKFRESLKEYQQGEETEGAKQFRDLMNSAFVIPQKGLAIETANTL